MPTPRARSDDRRSALAIRIIRILAGLALLALATYLYQQQETPPARGPQQPSAPTAPSLSPTGAHKEAPQEPAPATQKESDRSATSKPNPLVMKNLRLKNEEGKVVYQGEIDLAPTLERIAAGEKFPHRNDGATFGNRERRLPQKPPGYYREYVVPTPGVRGPGPQRLVIGREGEVYYTADHYKSFRRVAIPPEEAPAHK